MAQLPQAAHSITPDHAFCHSVAHTLYNTLQPLLCNLRAGVTHTLRLPKTPCNAACLPMVHRPHSTLHRCESEAATASEHPTCAPLLSNPQLSSPNQPSPT